MSQGELTLIASASFSILCWGIAGLLYAWCKWQESRWFKSHSDAVEAEQDEGESWR